MTTVYMQEPKNVSIAMRRVVEALAKYAPKSITIVPDTKKADFQVLHVIGQDALAYDPGKPHAVIQYCYLTAGGTKEEWQRWWNRARVVWSYYDLRRWGIGDNFYHAPLGVDGSVFCSKFLHRPHGIITSGFVAGPGAEAIEEPANAALQTGISCLHVGPDKIENMRPRAEASWTSFKDLSDAALANLFSKTKWVSGLRHCEGFELPALEGLVCGARPIVFDREEMRHWYNGHAVFVPEMSGKNLTDRLVDILSEPPRAVTPQERAGILERFSWKKIAEGFWERTGL
jgi:hypothetical protein